MILDDVNEWLSLSSKERRGSFLLVMIIAIIAMSYSLVDRYYKPQVILNEQQIQLIDSLIIVHLSVGKEWQEDEKYDLKLRAFNPNQVTLEELKQMGIPDQTSQIWMNYLKSGAQFYKSKDLLKIYSMDSSLYYKIESFLRFPNYNKKTISAPKSSSILTQQKRALFNFDPNTISEDSMRLLSLPSKVIANLLNYRAAGGKFLNVTKLKEMYAISDSIYEVLKPYVRIDSISLREKSNKTAPIKGSIKPPLINLNKADSAALIVLKGIGPSRAKFIIRRRTNIGGFYSTQQLYDHIFNLDSATVRSIEHLVFVDSTYQRIDLKHIDPKTLSRHHYFDYNMAKSAINYFRLRDQKNGLDQFLSGSPISKDKWEKARPYLELN